MKTMTAAQPRCAEIAGVRSLEVRWIYPGLPMPAMAEWFRRFPAQTRMIEDVYLLDPYLPGVSVKVRAGRALEVKRYHGSPGLLETGCARGRLECWKKWSVPCDQPRHDSDHLDGWKRVSKRRRISWFSTASGSPWQHGTGPGEEPGCALELTEVYTGGRAWWTVGFEATGPVSLLSDELQAAAALVFAQALPGGVELGMAHSASYTQWLRQLPGA